MDKISGQKSAVQYLYPPIDPFDQQIMEMPGGHAVYFEQCGAPDGVPVIVLHGGPGGGCSPAMRRYFDPSVFRVILFDQRGCGRSRPHSSVTNNTTWDLVDDIERIREALGISEFIVFGGSWGATLALIYAQAHPDRVTQLVLRGVFLMTRSELTWFYGGGAGHFWPELWNRFASLVPEDERHDLIAAYNKRLFSGNLQTETKFARAWSSWENALASVSSAGRGGDAPGEYARAFARLENHYFINGGFLGEDRQILDNMDLIEEIPGVIVQGRYDMICPPTSAYELAKRWPQADLRMIANSGHALSEPRITEELVRTMDQIAESL